MRKAKINLVFSSVGDRSGHSLWIKGDNRDFDLVLYHYGTSPALEPEAELFVTRRGTKRENFCHFYDHHRGDLDKYESIFVVDDDILIGTDALNSLFAIAREHDLWLSQPAFAPGSHIHWPITRQVPNSYLRFTNFVEVGVTLFSRPALERVIDAMRNGRSGWGLDMIYSQLLGDPTDKIAVIDAVPCVHPHRGPKNRFTRYIAARLANTIGLRRDRSLGEMDKVMTREAMQAEGRALLETYGRSEWLVPVVHGSVESPADAALHIHADSS